MERLRRIHEAVVHMNRIFRGAFTRLKYFRGFIANGEFNIEDWRNSNTRDIDIIRASLDEYRWSIGQNIHFINQLDGCLIHWQTVTDLYIENLVNFDEKNLYFIDGQIAHIEEIIQVCENEEQRIEQLMAAARIAQ